MDFETLEKTVTGTTQSLKRLEKKVCKLEWRIDKLERRATQKGKRATKSV